MAFKKGGAGVKFAIYFEFSAYHVDPAAKKDPTTRVFRLIGSLQQSPSTECVVDCRSSRPQSSVVRAGVKFRT